MRERSDEPAGLAERSVRASWVPVAGVAEEGGCGRRSRGAARSNHLLILASVVAVSVLAVLGLALHVASQSDAEVAARDMDSIKAMLTEHAARLSDAVVQSIASNHRTAGRSEAERAQRWADTAAGMMHDHPAIRLFLTDAAGRVVPSAAAPAPGERPVSTALDHVYEVTRFRLLGAGALRAADLVNADGHSWRTTVFNVLLPEGPAIVAAATPAVVGGGDSGRRIYGVIEPINVATLGHLSKVYGLPELGVVPGPPASPHLVPVVDHAGRVIAGLSWQMLRPGAFIVDTVMPAAIVLVVVVMALAGAAVLNVRSAMRRLADSERRAVKLARTDGLTGLANRMRFLDEIAALCAAGEPFALLIIDLDRFKEVNDSHGHSSGDAVLRTVAGRLPRVAGAECLTARLGGDEFGIVLRGARSSSAIALMARDLLDAISRPIRHAGMVFDVGVSIGCAESPRHGRDLEVLMARADIALYAAKLAGRGRVAFFQPEMEEETRARQALERDLRQALAAGELDVHYQPIVRGSDRKVCAVEALARWTHAERGVVPPSLFVPIAEECGLIERLGSFVMERACRHAAGLGDIDLSLNLSAVQLQRGDVAGEIRRVLADTGFPAHRLIIEITESVLIENEAVVTAALDALRALGVRIALDDFGTGYSSLAYLERFCFDKVKIDRRFVTRMVETASGAAIVRAIVMMGRALGMTLVAEGVETADQYRVLAAAGCHEMQGYLFGRPMPITDLSALLASDDGPAPDERREPGHDVQRDRDTRAA